MKIPMPETSDWKTSCGSWEGFCKTVRKSIANNLGSGIIKFNKMTNLEKIAYLNEIWYNLISSSDSGHKDRDCHFYISQTFSYGQKGQWTVAHHGYINHKYEETSFDTYEECQVEMINLLKNSIIEEASWYLEHYGDPDWDQHPKYGIDDLEEIITRVMLITNK
jgi:hypothetical protein